MRRVSAQPACWRRGVALLGALALLAAGCATSHRPPPIPLARNQVFHYNYPVGATDVATMDPQQVQDSGSYGVVQLVFDGLVALDANLNVAPWGARSWDISTDGLTYTFHLRSGQAFSNGTPVTSTDYAYSINRVINPCVASPVSYYLTGTANELIKDSATFNSETCSDPKAGTLAPARVQTAPLLTTLVGDSILTPDDQTLVIRLSHPAGYFLEAMTYPVTYAVDPSVVGPVLSNETWTDKLYQGATGQGGSGMFYVARWDHSGSIVLKRNPHWWGLSQGKKPTLSEIDFTIYAHNDAAYAAYQAGQFDAGFPTADLVPQAQHQPGYHQVPTLTTYALVMNWNIAPFNNLDARLALCLAIDRDALNQQLYGGRYLSTWHLVPQGMPGYNPALTGPDGVTSTQGDAHDARAHWQAYLRSLHGATPPPIVFSYIGESISQQQRAQTVQQQWQAVLGVHVAANAVYPGDFVVVDDSSAPTYFIQLASRLPRSAGFPLALAGARFAVRHGRELAAGQRAGSTGRHQFRPRAPRCALSAGRATLRQPGGAVPALPGCNAVSTASVGAWLARGCAGVDAP